MKRVVSIFIFGLMSGLFCFGQDAKITSLKELIEKDNTGGYYTVYVAFGKVISDGRSSYSGVDDDSDLLFLVEQDDYIIPIKLVKKDLGAGKRFRSLGLQQGDSLTI